MKCVWVRSILCPCRTAARRQAHPAAHQPDDRPASDLIDCYAQRMVIENTIADAINFFHMDALSTAVPMKVDLDAQLTVMASATIEITPADIIVTVGLRAHNPNFLKAGFAECQNPIPRARSTSPQHPLGLKRGCHYPSLAWDSRLVG